MAAADSSEFTRWAGAFLLDNEKLIHAKVELVGRVSSTTLRRLMSLSDGELWDMLRDSSDPRELIHRLAAKLGSETKPGVLASPTLARHTLGFTEWAKDFQKARMDQARRLAAEYGREPIELFRRRIESNAQVFRGQQRAVAVEEYAQPTDPGQEQALFSEAEEIDSTPGHARPQRRRRCSSMSAPYSRSRRPGLSASNEQLASPRYVGPNLHHIRTRAFDSAEPPSIVGQLLDEGGVPSPSLPSTRGRRSSVSALVVPYYARHHQAEDSTTLSTFFSPATDLKPGQPIRRRSKSIAIPTPRRIPDREADEDITYRRGRMTTGPAKVYQIQGDQIYNNYNIKFTLLENIDAKKLFNLVVDFKPDISGFMAAWSWTRRDTHATSTSNDSPPSTLGKRIKWIGLFFLQLLLFPATLPLWGVALVAGKLGVGVGTVGLPAALLLAFVWWTEIDRGAMSWLIYQYFRTLVMPFHHLSKVVTPWFTASKPPRRAPPFDFPAADVNQLPRIADQARVLATLRTGFVEQSQALLQYHPDDDSVYHLDDKFGDLKTQWGMLGQGAYALDERIVDTAASIEKEAAERQRLLGELQACRRDSLALLHRIGSECPPVAASFWRSLWSPVVAWRCWRQLGIRFQFPQSSGPSNTEPSMALKEERQKLLTRTRTLQSEFASFSKSRIERAKIVAALSDPLSRASFETHRRLKRANDDVEAVLGKLPRERKRWPVRRSGPSPGSSILKQDLAAMRDLTASSAAYTLLVEDSIRTIREWAFDRSGESNALKSVAERKRVWESPGMSTGSLAIEAIVEEVDLLIKAIEGSETEKGSTLIPAAYG